MLFCGEGRSLTDMLQLVKTPPGICSTVKVLGGGIERKMSFVSAPVGLSEDLGHWQRNCSARPLNLVCQQIYR